MIKKEQPKKNLGQIMQEYAAQFSITLSEGFANLSLTEKGDFVVNFLNDEGYGVEDMTLKLEDVQKVGNFMKELKELRLQDYKS